MRLLKLGRGVWDSSRGCRGHDIRWREPLLHGEHRCALCCHGAGDLLRERGLCEVDCEAIIDEIEDIDKKLEFSKNVDTELRKDRSDFMQKVLISMNHLREVVNDGIETEDYDDLFTTNNKPYTGSEATEFYLARVYSLAKHVKHQLPIVIDSFRAEELSTRREDLALPLYEELQNQVILSATLKGQEVGKYDERTDVHSIDFSGYTVNHLLSENYVRQFMRKLESFNVKLNIK